MAANDGYRRYIEAAAVLGQITRARAEEIMREIMSGGDVPRAQAQEWVDDMVDRSRKATESIVDMIRSEVANQMEALGIDPEDLARQAADIMRRSADAGRRVMQDVAQSRGGQRRPRTGSPAGAGRTSAPGAKTVSASTKKSAAKASAAKASAAKKAAAKQSAPKKTAAKAVAAKKATPKKAAPNKVAPKKSAPKKAAPKKSAPKKAAPKKAAAARPAKEQGSGTTP